MSGEEFSHIAYFRLDGGSSKLYTQEYVDKKDKEIERLKEEYIILQNASDEVEEEKDKEIERLNNIINELEKYLWEERYNHHGEYVLSGRKAEDIYTLILDKLEELKGVDKE